MKAVVGAFNQEEALVGAFSVIVKLRRLTVCSTTAAGFSDAADVSCDPDPGLHHRHRGAAAGRPQHGPRGLRRRGGQQEVELGQGVHQLSLLQRGGQSAHVSVCPLNILYLQYFVFDFHMAPVMLFDKIISFTVGHPLICGILWYNFKM